MSPQEIEERAIALFGQKPNKRLSTSFELRFGNHGSLSVKLTGERAGLWFSHEAGSGGCLLDADDRPALPASRRDAPGPSPSADKLRDTLKRLCEVDDPAAHVRGPLFREQPETPARLYLARRGICRWPHSVNGWAGRGIAFLAQSVDGSVLAIQVMHLHQDGSKYTDYWPDGVVKRTYSAVREWHRFAAVRMPGRGRLILCEGPETGLSIWLATGRPVAACLGSAGIAALRTGKQVTIAGDADKPGSPAATALDRAVTQRRSRGQNVTVVMPPYGDFNDIHMEHGLGAIREIFDASANNRTSDNICIPAPDGGGDNKRRLSEHDGSHPQDAGT